VAVPAGEAALSADLFKESTVKHARQAVVGVALVLLASIVIARAAGDAKGTLTYTSKGKALTLQIAHAYLITGPDAVDPKITIRRLLFTNADIDAKLTACTTMNCADTAMGDGLQVDLVAGPRFNYWLTLNGQLVQYSGSARPDVLTASANTPTHVAGTLGIDDTSAGGPKVDVTFDAALTKTFTKAR
jgi:hypothetical protein